MPSWKGNTYNRRKELPKFLKKLNTKALQEYGQKKTNKSFMTNYNYAAEDIKRDVERNNTPVRSPFKPKKTKPRTI